MRARLLLAIAVTWCWHRRSRTACRGCRRPGHAHHHRLPGIGIGLFLGVVALHPPRPCRPPADRRLPDRAVGALVFDPSFNGQSAATAAFMTMLGLVLIFAPTRTM
jgi:hypothetical protein